MWEQNLGLSRCDYPDGMQARLVSTDVALSEEHFFNAAVGLGEGLTGPALD